MRVTVLGAGYMGSAMAKVAAQRGHAVTLWGTWLDNALLDVVLEGKPHPRLGLALTDLRLCRAEELPEALCNAELVIHAVSSEGAVAVMTRAAPYLPDVPVLSVTKGFLANADGQMDRIDRVIPEVLGRAVRFVHAAGPAKAVEIARGVLTLMVFAGADAIACRDALAGGNLRVAVTDDIAGAEIASALKNAYATGLGLWDGLGHVSGAHNARAACFAQSIHEMCQLACAGGGRAETIYGAAGVGDLHVTAAAGRNRAFGERVGKGKPARDVAAEMLASGELTEGYAAIATAWRFAREHHVDRLPLLEVLHQVVWEDVAASEALARLDLL